MATTLQETVPARERVLGRVERALDVAISAVAAATDPPSGVSSTVHRGLRARTASLVDRGDDAVVGDCALLLCATEELAGSPGVGDARTRLAVGLDTLPAPRTRALDLGLLGRPGLDVMGAGRRELRLLAECALVLSDAGRRPTGALVRVPDAEAALALALDSDDLDLVARVLWLWPALGLPWTTAARFAFGLVEPGTVSDGVLCAALAVSPVCADRSARDDVLALPTPPPAGAPRWVAAYRELDLADRSALAPLVLTVVLRRARDARDAAALRTAVKVALAHGLLDAPAPRQAADLLRRSWCATRRTRALAG